MRRLIKMAFFAILCGTVPLAMAAVQVATEFTDHFGSTSSKLMAHVQTGIIQPGCSMSNPHSCWVKLNKGSTYHVKFTRLEWGNYGPEIKTVCEGNFRAGDQEIVDVNGVCEDVPKLA